MIDEEQTGQSDDGDSSIFVVKLEDGDFALCEWVETVDGTTVLPGSGKTVAELVAEQSLQAASVSSGSGDDRQELAAMMQSGENRNNA